MSRKECRRFYSILAPQLRAYLDFKQALGYTSFAIPYTAQDLDHYLLFRGLSTIQGFDEGLIVQWMHSIPRATGTKNIKLKFARGFCRYLLRLGLISDNPAMRIPYLKERHQKPYIFTIKELDQIFAQARALQRRYPNRLLGWTMETMLFLIYACGLRLGEALNLKLRDVDLDSRTLSLWKTKFHKERLVPFSPAVAHKLRAYLLRRERFFPTPTPDEPFFRHGHTKYRGRVIVPGYRQVAIGNHFRGFLVRSGIIKRGGRGAPRVHDLRHTFAVHRLYKWYQEGYDVLNKLPLLSTYMGHVEIENTQVYLTICLALLREGDRRFQAGFGDLAERALKRAFGKL